MGGWCAGKEEVGRKYWNPATCPLPCMACIRTFCNFTSSTRVEEERERKTEETYTCVSLLNIKVFKSFQTKEQSVFYILEVEVRPIQKDLFLQNKST